MPDKAVGTYEWVFENRGAEWVGEDYDGSTFVPIVDVNCSNLTAVGSAAFNTSNATNATAVCEARQMAAEERAREAISVARDALFVRMRVANSSLRDGLTANVSGPVPLNNTFSTPSWQLTLLDLGGRSYFDVMIRGERSKLTADMSPIHMTDGFVVLNAELPTLPSDGEKPDAGLAECGEGYQSTDSSDPLRLSCGDDGELFVSSGSATCEPIPCDSTVPPLGDARIGWFLEGFDLDGIIIPSDTRQPWAQGIQTCLHGYLPGGGNTSLTVVCGFDGEFVVRTL